MQTKTFLCAALLSAVSLVIAESAPQSHANTTHISSAAQQSKIAHDTDVYFSSVTAAPDWSSYSVIFAKSDSADLLAVNTKDLSDITANPSFTALPKSAQSYFISERKGALSIASQRSVATSMANGTTTSTATGTATPTGGAAPKPTGAIMAAGAAAAGLLGIVAML
ncbi:hypothetical protein MMC22_008646 [Lobaria immixta]|nr:hypothetical protein [Lobaria immixta]